MTDAIEISEVARNLAIVAAAILGGIWSAWKWFLEERLRRKKLAACIDGQLLVESTPIDEHRVAVTVEAHWRNSGEFPVGLDTDRTQVKIFHLPEDIPSGTIVSGEDLGSPLYRHFIYPEGGSAALEPGTNSRYQSHFVLESGKRYLAVWNLCQLLKDAGRIHWWTREKIFFVPDRGAT